jgi:hypothetical protein
MNLKFTKGLDTERKKEIKEAFVASHTIRERMRQVLKEDLDAVYRDMGREDNFSLPAWSEHQAYRLGETEALRKLISLLED